MEREEQDMIYKEIEDIIGYHFKDKNLLLTALTHPSFKGDKGAGSYERLEFLGDSVLNLYLAEYVFKHFPEMSEGDMSEFRSYFGRSCTLAEIGKKIKLPYYLRLGKGEVKSGGNTKESILASAFEAMIGAIYLEGGMEKAKEVLDRLFCDYLKVDILEAIDSNPKGFIQEYCHKIWKLEPRYKVIYERGPSHGKIFNVEVELPDGIKATGEGKSKREAETRAALKIIEKLGLNKVKKD